MDPIHPVSFQTVFQPFLNVTQRQPGREQDSLTNIPQPQRTTLARGVQNASLRVGVPDRITDTGQTGSNAQRITDENGVDSLTALNSISILDIPNQQNSLIEIADLAKQFQQYHSVDTIMNRLQPAAQELPSGVELSGMASIEIHELIQLIKQISKDSKSIDQLMEYIEGQTGEQNTAETAGVAIGQGFTLAISNAQQADPAVIEQEQVKITSQIEVTLSTRLNENGEETADRVLRINFNGEQIVNTEVITVGQSDPLVLDLDGDGIELSTVEDGVFFDINADGFKEKTAFVTGGDAFLALDRNENGIIDNGGELFGDQHGALDGFEELRRFDFNSDGMIDEQDSVFSSLLLFNDQNRDGVSQLSEIHTLKQKRIEAVLLDSAEDVSYQINGNPIIKASTYVLKDGSQHRLADALLNYLS